MQTARRFANAALLTLAATGTVLAFASMFLLPYLEPATFGLCFLGGFSVALLSVLGLDGLNA